MPQALSATIGNWDISVTTIGAQCGKLTSGETFGSSVYRFPVGYRVGKVWTNGVTDVTDQIPKRVLQKARGLAARLTDED